MATDLGVIRNEVAASIIDATEVVVLNDPVKKKALRLPQSIANESDRSATYQLIDIATNTIFTLPAGSSIKSVVIRKVASAALDSALVLTCGFSTPFMLDTTRKATLATRIADATNFVGGPLLNQHLAITFNEVLNATEVAAQNTLYDAEMTAQSLPARAAVDYTILTGISGTFVGESRDLVPVATVTAGTVGKDDIEFVFYYTEA